MQRLDKALSDVQFASRKDLKNLIKHGRVSVNGTIVRESDFKIDTSKDTVCVDDENVRLLRRIICILNKPAGYVTSTDDPRDPTVMELLPEEYVRMGVIPAGRLDKDTEGLLVCTNDGDLIHTLISPKSEIEKVYYAEHEGLVTDDDIKAFKDGITLKDGTLCKTAILERISDGRSYIKITEGMYHQVRRMMASRGLKVNFLKRISEGKFNLGDLETGKTREI